MVDAQQSLSEFLEQVQSEIREKFQETYSVVAEIASMSGTRHMYFELVEKQGGKIMAKCRANLWAFNRFRVIGHFERMTRESLKKGMKVLFRVQPDFHIQYGFSFTIVDIDPSYSLGEFERIKQETIRALAKDGLLELNKHLELPLVMNRLAIVTSETAAGYQDFRQHLYNNPWTYHFEATLFPCLVQGEKAPESIIAALDQVEMDKRGFDAIVLIRGGGSVIDLSCFDDYNLNFHLAQSSYPVITGIGHDQDESVADLVAHTHLKTPTAVAEYIVNHNALFEDELLRTGNVILQICAELVNTAGDRLDNCQRDLMYLSRESSSIAERQLERLIGDIQHLARTCLYQKKNDIELQRHLVLNKAQQCIKDGLMELTRMETQIAQNDPVTLFRKGYALTLREGKRVDLSDLKVGDRIQTLGENISITSTINKIE